MSSPTHDGSLSELMLEVGSIMGSMAYPREQFTRMMFVEAQQRINWLQTTCPNHSGVLAARIWWYELALERFNELVVVPASTTGTWSFGERMLCDIWDDDNPMIVCGSSTLDHFMRRCYLKGNFSRLSRLLEEMYTNLSRAPIIGNKGKAVRHTYGKLALRLVDDIWEGRL